MNANPSGRSCVGKFKSGDSEGSMSRRAERSLVGMMPKEERS